MKSDTFRKAVEALDLDATVATFHRQSFSEPRVRRGRTLPICQ
jgi:hypothetical protein